MDGNLIKSRDDLRNFIKIFPHSFLLHQHQTTHTGSPQAADNTCKKFSVCNAICVKIKLFAAFPPSPFSHFSVTVLALATVDGKKVIFDVLIECEFTLHNIFGFGFIRKSATSGCSISNHAQNRQSFVFATKLKALSDRPGMVAK